LQQTVLRLYEMFMPVVNALGLSVVDVEWLPARGSARLSVLIARRHGSVSITDCEDVTQALAEVLEAAPEHAQSYTLEVSSPGLDRVLKRPHEFEVFAGRTIDISLSTPLLGKTEFQGILQGREGDKVLLELASGEMLSLPMPDIKKAKLVFKMK